MFTGGSRRARGAAKLISPWLFGALFAFAPELRAQEKSAAPAPGEGPPGYVLVTVDSREPDLILTLRNADASPPLTCLRRCTFWAKPGDYSLLVTSQHDGLHHEETVEVGRHTQFRARSWNEGERTAGLIAGIAGPLAMVSGVALFFAEIAKDTECNEPSCEGHAASSDAPGWLLLGGLGSTVLGWLVYAASAPRVDALREPSPRPHRAMPSVGVIPLQHSGWALGISSSF